MYLEFYTLQRFYSEDTRTFSIILSTACTLCPSRRQVHTDSRHPSCQYSRAYGTMMVSSSRASLLAVAVSMLCACGSAFVVPAGPNIAAQIARGTNGVGVTSCRWAGSRLSSSPSSSAQHGSLRTSRSTTRMMAGAVDVSCFRKCS